MNEGESWFLEGEMSKWPLAEFINIDDFHDNCPKSVEVAQENADLLTPKTFFELCSQAEVEPSTEEQIVILGIKNNHAYILAIQPGSFGKISSSDLTHLKFGDEIEVAKDVTGLSRGSNIIRYHVCVPKDQYELRQERLRVKSDVKHICSEASLYFIHRFHCSESQLELIALLSVHETPVLALVGLGKPVHPYKMVANDCLEFAKRFARRIALMANPMPVMSGIFGTTKVISAVHIVHPANTKSTVDNFLNSLVVTKYALKYFEKSSRNSALSAESAGVSGESGIWSARQS